MPEISEEEFKAFMEAKKSAEALAATKARLEDENSKIKKRAQEAESKLTDAEKKKLEAEGEKDKLLQIEREERLKTEEKLKSMQKKSLQDRLRAEAAKVAKDAHNIDMVLKVTDHKDLLKIDEEAGTVSGIEEFIAKTRETHPFLYGAKSLPDYDNKKGADGMGNEKDPDTSMTDEERYRAELKKVTSKKELAAVRKKYGKEVDTFDSIY